MRPVLLAVAIAATPAIALAQTPAAAGKVEFSPDSTVGQSECLASSGAVLDSATWTIQPDTGTTIVPGGGIYKIIGSNTAPPTATGGDGGTRTNYCYQPGATSTSHPDLRSGFVQVQVPGSGLTDKIPVSSVTQTVLDLPIPQVMAAAGLGACTETTTPEVPVHVCVHYYRRSGTTDPPTYESDPTGYAHGTLTLSFSKPPAPRNVIVQPGDRRLRVSFGAGEVTTGLVGSSEFRATATPVCTTPPPAPPAPQTCPAAKSSSRVSSSPAVVEGLENYQLYDVVVYAYSSAGNEGPPSSPAAAGTPLPVTDFWEHYRESGGVEQGGCASGAAGALALLGAATLLALRRRSR